MIKAFKAYDIRGVYGKDFTKEIVYKIGFFLPELFKTNTILVGRDVRVSSPEIFEALTNGITDAGCQVHDLGLCTTPFVYWVTAKYAYEASVMITASHNPKEHNGLKISRKNALPVGFDSGLGELQTWVETREIKITNPKAAIVPIDYKTEYIQFQQKYLSDFSSLKMVMDCSNGMSSLFVKELYGNAPYYLFDTLDGSFPNHEPNPLEPENIKALQQKVLETKADIGIIFDGDADRVMFVDEKGNFISPDLLIAVLARYFFTEKKLKGTVLQDIRTSKSVTEEVERLGGTMAMWRVGRAYAALKLREIDGLFGGELAGHYYFKDFYYSDSALLACSLLLGEFVRAQKNGTTVSQLIAQIKTYANTGEMNFVIEDKEAAMQAVKDYFTAKQTPTAFYDFDGYRIEFEDWWFNIRPSNTEPYLRFIGEARTQIALDEKVKELKEILSAYISKEAH